MHLLVPLVLRAILTFGVLFCYSILKGGCNMKEKQYKEKVKIGWV